MLIWRWDIYLILLFYCLDMILVNYINFKWSFENNVKFLIVLFYCFMISKKKIMLCF